MPIVFWSKDDMLKAKDLGEECKIFEGYDYNFNPNEYRITFYPEKSEQQIKFVCALNVYNKYSGMQPIVYHIV